MKALICGYGSIGKRHKANLNQIGISEIDVFDPFTDSHESFLKSQAELSPSYDFVLICSPNHLHLESFKQNIEKSRYFFIEKPILTSTEESKEFLEVAQKNPIHVMVGCNYRFEQGLSLLKKELEKLNGKIHFVDCEYGHHLSQWRKTDYRKSYSAHRSQGGGICLDRIHEFDYLKWLFGDFKINGGLVSKVSDLEIDTEDLAELQLSFLGGFKGRLHLDYLQRAYKCKLSVITEVGDYHWSFIPTKLEFVDKQKVTHFLFQSGDDVNQMYVDQLKYFVSCVKAGRKPMNEISEAVDTLRLVESSKALYV